MDSQNAKQVSSEFESALSAIMPDLAQLLRNYQVSEILEISVAGDGVSLASCPCCLRNNRLVCGYAYVYTQPEDADNTLGLTLAKARQLCEDVGSKLSELWASLSPSVQEFSSRDFYYSLLVDPATADTEQKTVCKWLKENSLQCSNT